MPLRNLPPRRWLSPLIAVFTGMVLFALILPAIQQAREAARRTLSRNNLHQIGLAMYNYHDVHVCLPTGGVVGATGKGQHGWMTFLLPYVDSSPLYNSIDFDHSWNASWNDEAICTWYPAYLMPGIAEVATIEGYALTHCQANPDVFYRNSNTTISDLSDDLESTWLVGETTGNHQPWGYPFNWRPLGDCLNCGPESFGRPSGYGACILFADGSVIGLISNEISADRTESRVDLDREGSQPDAAAISCANGFASFRT